MLWRSIWPPLAILAILVVSWAALAAFGPWPPYLFPGPGIVLNTLARFVEEGTLVRALRVTLFRLVEGFLIALVFGALLALPIARYSRVRRGVHPFLVGLQSLPGVAWVPLGILWFGYGEPALLFVTVMGSSFSVTLALVDAIVSVSPTTILAGRNMGLHGVRLIAMVGLPAALPQIVAGLRQSWSFAWRSLVSAEIVFATIGLGFLLNRGREFFDASEVLAMMGMILILGVLFERGIFGVLEERLFRRHGFHRG